MPSETKRIIDKVVDEINSDLTIAQVADKNTIARIRHITKDILSHSYKAEKSKIGGLGESIGTLILTGATYFMGEEKRRITGDFIQDNSEKNEKKIQELEYKWSQAKAKLNSYNIENLFKVIKINKTFGFRSALSFILENRIYLTSQ